MEPDPAGSGSRTALLLALTVAGLAAFLTLAVSFDAGWVRQVDEDVAAWVADELPAWIEWAARPWSWLGGWIGLTALGVVVTVLLLRERAWLDLAFFLTAFVGSQLAAALFKATFERPRPDVGSAVPLPSSSAFPSGHATAGVASLGALVVLAAERIPSRGARVWLWTAAIVAGLAVGLSRIALGVHFVSDVVAGWCLGLAWLAGALLVRDALRDR